MIKPATAILSLLESLILHHHHDYPNIRNWVGSISPNQVADSSPRSTKFGLGRRADF